MRRTRPTTYLLLTLAAALAGCGGLLNDDEVADQFSGYGAAGAAAGGKAGSAGSAGSSGKAGFGGSGGAPATCGDSICQAPSENCANCEKDCGLCGTCTHE